MTQSRATYWAWVENQRNHKAMEYLERAKQDEAAKHNRIMEEQGQQNIAELERAHRAAEANAILATQQAEEASKRNYEAQTLKSRTDERIARMQTTANAAQKQADRDIQQRIADMNNNIQSGQLAVSERLAANTEGRTQAEIDKWGAEIENASKNYDLNVNKYLLDAEDLARRKADSKAARDLAKARFNWEKRQADFNNALNALRYGNETITTTTKAFNDLTNSANNIVKIGRQLLGKSNK